MIPLAEDVVIHRVVHSPAVYLLSRHGAEPQIKCKTYEEASARAAAFATAFNVDVWYTMDESSYKSVTRHRRHHPA